MNPPARIHLSRMLSIPFATLIYALSGAVVGASAIPSALVIIWAGRILLPQAAAGRIILFCIAAGGALYLLFFCGLLLTGLLMRLLSAGVRPGRHRLVSGAGAIWMAMNGVQAIASRLFLPAVPGGYFPTMYFRLAGCRIGRDVWIGAHSVICAGATIGDGASVGIRAFLRKGTTVPAGAHVAAPGGMSPRNVVGLEKGFKSR